MLTVKTPEEVLALIETVFVPLTDRVENVELSAAIGRVLADDVIAAEYVPDFDRSTVDGYAVRAEDTFWLYGCNSGSAGIARRGFDGTGSKDGVAAGLLLCGAYRRCDSPGS